MHLHFVTQPSLGSDPEQVPHQQHPHHQFRINRWAPGVTVQMFYLSTDKGKIYVLVNESKNMIGWNKIVWPKIVEKLFLFAPLA